jgi:diadenosine tetraphosphatase ApaH/serine/threonine PP2A family protein phosphatase
LSDIHSNLEALQAVLADIATQQVDKIYCLGDVIGYGPNPRECLDLARGWDLVLLGNHDHAVLFEPRDFNPIAEEATFWTRRQLDAPNPDQEGADRRWEFLAELPLGHSEGGVILVHGSVRQPLNEYVFPADIHNKGKMDRLFAQVEQFCFQGHTHVPGIFTERREFFAPADIDYSYTRRQGKIICNVGSVGQPRDGDWRSCYILFDGQTITFRRVEYDVETTVKKIHAIPELDRFLGDRLLLGR